jgi:hypothetical protein
MRSPHLRTPPAKMAKITETTAEEMEVDSLYNKLDSLEHRQLLAVCKSWLKSGVVKRENLDSVMPAPKVKHLLAQRSQLMAAIRTKLPSEHSGNKSNLKGYLAAESAIAECVKFIVDNGNKFRKAEQWAIVLANSDGMLDSVANDIPGFDSPKHNKARRDVIRTLSDLKAEAEHNLDLRM